MDTKRLKKVLAGFSVATLIYWRWVDVHWLRYDQLQRKDQL